MSDSEKPFPGTNLRCLVSVNTIIKNLNNKLSELFLPYR